MELSSLERAFSVATIVYIGAVIVAAVATFFVSFFASRLSTAKDAELQRFQRESAEAIAQAHTRAAEANARAAEATQKAEELSLKVEEESRKRAEAERSLLELQEHLFMPRSFDWDKAKAVLDKSPKYFVDVRYVPNDLEASMLAWRLASLLDASGWHVAKPGEGSASVPFVGVLFEIGVGNTGKGVNEETLAPHILALVKALGLSRNDGYPGIRDLGGFNTGARQDLPDGDLIIFVGPKY